MKHEKSYSQNRHPHRPPDLKSNHQTIYLGAARRDGGLCAPCGNRTHPSSHAVITFGKTRYPSVPHSDAVAWLFHISMLYEARENPSTFTCRWGQSICYETTTKNVECHDRISHAPMTLLVKTNIISLCPRLGKSTTQKNSIDSLEMKYIKMKNIIFSCTPSTLPRQHTPP